MVSPGRRVLSVSEKAAALNVVRNRLHSIGLGDFVMALHSGHGRADVTGLQSVI
jgi:hypothetical protein